MMDDHDYDEYVELQDRVRLWRGIINGLAISFAMFAAAFTVVMLVFAIARADEPLWITVDPNELSFSDTIYLQSCVMVDQSTICIVKED